jgi:hypothetical protein
MYLYILQIKLDYQKNAMFYTPLVFQVGLNGDKVR